MATALAKADQPLSEKDRVEQQTLRLLRIIAELAK